MQLNSMRTANNLTISVIIPTYNRSSWLIDCIESVVQQTSLADEIILIDDGSTDNTAEIVKKYPSVYYHFQKNKGPSAARNAGAKIAKGEWLAFLDSDDKWTPQKLQWQRAFLMEYPLCNAVYTNEIWIRNGLRVNQKKSIKNMVDKFTKDACRYASSVLLQF